MPGTGTYIQSTEVLRSVNGRKNAQPIEKIDIHVKGCLVGHQYCKILPLLWNIQNMCAFLISLGAAGMCTSIARILGE